MRRKIVMVGMMAMVWLSGLGGIPSKVEAATRFLYWPVPSNKTIACGVGCYEGHNGIDIGVSTNSDTPIYAAATGIVDVVQNGQPYGYNRVTSPANGNYVKLKHVISGITYYTYYLHLKDGINLTAGASINAGALVGYGSSSGLTCGTQPAANGGCYGQVGTYYHLHFELRDAGLNPIHNIQDYWVLDSNGNYASPVNAATTVKSEFDLTGDFNGDGLNDILVVSGDASLRRRRMYLAPGDGTNFVNVCSGDNGDACGLDDDDYMFHPNTKMIVGKFNNDNRDDLLVISGDTNLLRRRVYLWKADNTGFEVSCTGDGIDSCGIDTETYMRDSNTKIIKGRFNNDNVDDLMVISGVHSFPRRRLLLGTANGNGFTTGCSGDTDGACTFDAEAYMSNSNTQFLVNDFTGDGYTDIFIISADAGYRRRVLHAGKADGTGFTVVCSGLNDGACGFDTETFTMNPQTVYLTGQFSGDSKADIMMISPEASEPRRRLYSGNGTGFTITCSGITDEACGFDLATYLTHPNTRFIVGKFNDDLIDDVLVVSGDPTYTRRRLGFGQASGAGFTTVCNGQGDSVCGLDIEGYTMHPGTRYLVGKFTTSVGQDLMLISGDPTMLRRRLYSSKATNEGFEVKCWGDTDGACGLDTEPYSYAALTRYL